MSTQDPMRWVWRGISGATLAFGWGFILWQNNFHPDVPVVVVCLAYLAVVLTITNLWRVGAAAVAPNTGDEWGRPLGERGELEKEKKTLLKAIKEAEFDFEMGKLSKLDADNLITMYRGRAIEVIKEIERIEAGVNLAAVTPRDAIELEVAARLALEEKTKKAAKQKADARKESVAAKAKEPEAKAKTKDDKAEAKAKEPEVKAKEPEAKEPEAKAKEPAVEKAEEPKAEKAEEPEVAKAKDDSPAVAGDKPAVGAKPVDETLPVAEDKPVPDAKEASS